MTVPKGKTVYAMGRVFKSGSEIPKGLEKVLEKPVKKSAQPKSVKSYDDKPGEA